MPLEPADAHNVPLIVKIDVDMHRPAKPIYPHGDRMDLTQAETVLRDIRKRIGYSGFDSIVKRMMRERVNSEREKRKRFPPREYQRLYDAQRGICPLCPDPLFIPAKRNEIDHKDPNRSDLNHHSNLQLAHPSCNRSKSSKSILERSKETGETFTSLIRTPIEDEV